MQLLYLQQLHNDIRKASLASFAHVNSSFAGTEGVYLGPVVLIPIIKLECDDADRYELNGAAPELAAHLCISSKGPVLPLTMSSNDCRVVHYLDTWSHKAVVHTLIHSFLAA